MGGSAFTHKGLTTVRLPLDAYAEVSASVLERLLVLMRGIRSAPVPYLRSKQDFGDLDIVVSRRLFDQVSFEAIASAFDAVAYTNMGGKDPVLSLAIETSRGLFQVDLISVHSESFDYAVRFFSWGDAGSFSSNLARQMGLRHGESGLYYCHEAPGGRVEVPLGGTYDDTLEFLGLDAAAHRAGFDRPEDVYRWIASGRYFDPAIYHPDRLTNKARARTRRRDQYQQFLSWMEGMPATYDWGARGSRLDEWRERIFEKYPTTPRLIELALTARNDDPFRQFFSGPRISAATGITGDELGHFMNAVRKHLGADLATIAAAGDQAALDAAIRAVLETDYLPARA